MQRIPHRTVAASELNIHSTHTHVHACMAFAPPRTERIIINKFAMQATQNAPRTGRLLTHGNNSLSRHQRTDTKLSIALYGAVGGGFCVA